MKKLSYSKQNKQRKWENKKKIYEKAVLFLFGQ